MFFVSTGRPGGVADSPIVPVWARRPERRICYGAQGELPFSLPPQALVSETTVDMCTFKSRQDGGEGETAPPWATEQALMHDILDAGDP